MKKLLSLLLAGALAAVPVLSLAEISFDGSVIAGEKVSVTAPFGGTVAAMALKAGTEISLGDTIAKIATTKVYATVDGTVSGVFGQPGDSVDSVTQRYGAVLYIAPSNKYQISASIDKAYNSSETRYVVIGETVYLSCTADGDHVGVGTVTAVDGTSYTVETTSGEFLMEETVYVYRSASHDVTTRIGRGTVSRTKETSVSGSGSILYLHVKDGDAVSRGDLLFETVTGTFDGLYATSDEIVSDVSGIVAEVNVSAGGTVNKGDTLITVYPREHMQIEIDVGEYDLPEIAEGDTVSLNFTFDEDNTQTLTGTVAMISQVSSAAAASASSSEATYKAYIDFVPTESIRMGMTVVVTAEGTAGTTTAAAE